MCQRDPDLRSRTRCGPAWGAVVVLAQEGSPASRDALLREISANWGNDVMAPMPWLIVAAGLLLLVLGAVMVMRRWRMRHLQSHPMLVFHQVAATAGLNWWDRWLLIRIARQQALPTPLTLLLSGRTLRVHGRAYVEAQPPWRRAPVLQRIASIRRSLFGRMGAAPVTG
ncbi:MAG: hypothetical protein ACODAQ_05985 [Phycisphaeraceae bacterium]